MTRTESAIVTGTETVTTSGIDLFGCTASHPRGGPPGSAFLLSAWVGCLIWPAPVIAGPQSAEPALPQAEEAVDRSDPRHLKISVGGEYISGEYGGDDAIEEIYLPLSIKYRGSYGSMQVTIPWVRVDTPDTGLVEGGTESGPGDIVVSATKYDVFAASNRDFLVDLTARVELGTADEDRGLGTGEHDYALQIDLYRYSGPLMFYGVAGYKLKGEPAEVSLDDTPYAVLGIDRRFTGSVNAGLDFRARESAFPGNDPLLEAGLYLGTDLSPDVFLLGFVSRGFTDSSPDWGIGFNLAFWY